MAKIMVFRCRICGDPYIGTEAPAQCPFCGAERQYFVEAKDWNPNEFNVSLNEVERKDLEAALKLELDNAAFYDCAKNAAQKADDEYGIAKFKALMKVEREHASAISKFLKISRPELEKLMCDKCIQICNAISQLNSKEGSTVTIHNQNPDFSGPSNRVDITRDFEGLEKTYFLDNIL